MVELKNRLKFFRFQHNVITQEELAEQVGVTRQTILAIEKGKFNPSMKLALQIARALGARVDEIFFLEGDEDDQKS